MDITIILAASHRVMVPSIKDMFAQTEMPGGIQFVVKTPSDMHLDPLPNWSGVNEPDMREHAKRVAQCVRRHGFFAMGDCTRLSVDGVVSTLTTVVAFIDRTGETYYSEASLPGTFRTGAAPTNNVSVAPDEATFVPVGQNGKKPLTLGEMRPEMVAICSHWGKAYRKIITEHKFKILQKLL